ncbi:MAG TPA: hypothetical protein VI277_00755 [Candidatus Limnocylindria bacterium]
MSGLVGDTGADQAATLVAALATLVVFGGLFGERRLFGWSQHLFAGLITGYLVLLAITEVIVPRLVAPLVADPVARPELWLGIGLVVTAAGAPWLPRLVAAVPVSIAIGAVAAFALGGAVIGTILPQLAASVARPDEEAVVTAVSAAAAVVSGLVLIGFIHGTPRGRMLAGASAAGRWLMLGGIGGWIGYLLLSRLVLLVDRISFLLIDWLGLGR